LSGDRSPVLKRYFADNEIHWSGWRAVSRNPEELARLFHALSSAQLRERQAPLYSYTASAA